MSKNKEKIKSSTKQSEGCEEYEFLANVGLLATTTVTEMRKSQPKKPKKIGTECGDDELFVKRPDFSNSRRNRNEAVDGGRTRKEVPVESEGDLSEEESEGEERKDSDPGNYSITGQRLYNFLTALSSHRWIWCEFVESFVDKPILAGAYTMADYMADCCSRLGTRHMPRRGWQLLRRHTGKARRFSPAFIELELQDLYRSRRIVRELQQYRYNDERDGPFMDQMPKRIPLPLAADAKVTGLLQEHAGHSLRGIVEGSVMDYDPQNSSYLVRFVKSGRSAVLSLPDSQLRPEQDTTALPLSLMMHGAQADTKEVKVEAAGKPDGGRREKFGNQRYDKELLESVLQVRRLLATKQKAVLEIAGMNEDFEGGRDCGRREAKQSPQREQLQRRYAASMIALHRVNTELLEPVHTLHEHLAEYLRQEAEQEARGGRPASEVFQKCRLQAELDLKTACGERSLHIESDCTRELICNLHTILYLNGRLGRENSCDMEAVLADLVAHMLDHMPPTLGANFKEALDSLDPLRQRVVEMFKAVEKPERFHITQQSPMQTEDGVFNFVVEAQPDGLP
ncbi:protein lin-9 homolog [Drosophila ficusphila]|uniref:protein lin-9 homolog n=1 Tax=Drosophila ficusphila TaxID=30025 RepID=UPI0007E883F4|nr:protein lin-9 homolog [Drosophila ficusphila]